MKLTVAANCVIAGLCASKLWDAGEQGWAAVLLMSAVFVAIIDVMRGA